MRILKITLENFRVHEALEIEFSKGINLLIGENGSGKSSILEALGLALYGAPLRTSADKDAIMIGKKYAEIKVDFTANDGLNYRAERRIGSGSRHRLYKAGEPKPLVEGVEHVLAKIAVLTGIPVNTDNIYQYVVTASQNRFTDVFTDKESARKTSFNLIFNTEIYKGMVDGYLKDALSGYEQKIALSENTLSQLGKNNRPSREIELEIEKEKASLEGLGLKKDEFLKRKKNSVEEESRLTGLKNSIEKMASEILGSQKLIQSSDERLKTAEQSLSGARNALKFVAEKKPVYDRYQELERLLAEAEKRMFLLEGYERELSQTKEEKSRLEKENGLLNQDSESRSTSVDEQKKALEALKEKIEKASRDINLLLEKEAKEKKDLSAALKHYEAFQTNYQELKKIDEALRVYAANEKQLADSLKDENEFDKSEALLTKELSNLETAISSKSALRTDRDKAQSRLDELRDAEKKLSGGVCPFLQEQCQNISGGSSASGYFSQRLSELTRQITALDVEIKDLAVIEVRKSTLEKDLHLLAENRKKQKETRSRLEALKNQWEKAEKDREISRLKLAAILETFEQSEEQKKYFEQEDLEPLDRSVYSGIKSRQNTIDSLKLEIERKREEMKELIANRDDSALKIEKDEGRIRENSDKVKRNNEKLTILLKKQADLDEVLKELPELKINRQVLLAEREKIKPDYHSVLSHIPESGKIAQYETEMASITNDLERFRKEQTLLTAQYNTSKDLYSDEKHQEVRALLKDADSAIMELSGEIGRAEQRLTGLKAELEKVSADRLKIESLQAELDLLNRKLELTIVFRDNVRDMGAFVSERMMQVISRKATENYRGMTGNTGRIEWSNREEAFLVSLVNSETNEERKYHVLSGGEQVAVALSMRAAMAETLTNCGIAIFDEPTINLDTARKQYLAESIQSIMYRLEQTIIVTHDNIFEDKAERVVRL